MVKKSFDLDRLGESELAYQTLAPLHDVDYKSHYKMSESITGLLIKFLKSKKEDLSTAEIQELERLYEHEYRYNPYDVNTLKKMSRYYLKKGNYQTSKFYAESAICMNEHSFDAKLILAQIELKAGYYKKATQHLAFYDELVNKIERFKKINVFGNNPSKNDKKIKRYQELKRQTNAVRLELQKHQK